MWHRIHLSCGGKVGEGWKGGAGDNRMLWCRAIMLLSSIDDYDDGDDDDDETNSGDGDGDW